MFRILILSVITGLSPILGATAQTVSDGGNIYQQYCSVCHGDKGDIATHARQGFYPPPRDFTDPAQTAHMNRELMLAAVRDGRPGTAMAAWRSRLSEGQIEAVIDYIREQFMTTASDQHGQQIYARSCSVCHGDQGKGANWGQDSMTPPPRDFTTIESSHELTRERMLIAVTYGRPGTAMQAFGSQLNDNDIAAVVDYIRDTFMLQNAEIESANSESDHEPAPQHSADTTLEVGFTNIDAPFPNGLSGDAQTGKAFYFANCATCHGKDGDGAGPRAYFIRPRPRNFLHPSSQLFNRPNLFRATRDGVLGREMPAWGKVLSDQQIADISEYVLQRFILGREVQ